MKNLVKELRGTRELSQADLGDVLGVSRQTIIAIERGRYLPSLPLAFAIARFFSMAIEDVFIPDNEDAR